MSGAKRFGHGTQSTANSYRHGNNNGPSSFTTEIKRNNDHHSANRTSLIVGFAEDKVRSSDTLGDNANTGYCDSALEAWIAAVSTVGQRSPASRLSTVEHLLAEVGAQFESCVPNATESVARRETWPLIKKGFCGAEGSAAPPRSASY